MARKSKDNSRDRRAHSNPSANQRLPARTPSPKTLLSPLLFADVSPPPSRPRMSLQPVEDRRVHHPEGANRPALTTGGRPAPVTVVNRPRKKKRANRAQINRFGPEVVSQTKGVLTFAAPDQTVVCIRRGRRKEVLFAKGKAGRRRMRPGRRTWLSKIGCR